MEGEPPAPKALTIAGPVGRSQPHDATRPIAVSAMPSAHAIAIRGPRRMENNPASAAGTMRYVKTSRTPAMRTDEVITSANDA